VACDPASCPQPNRDPEGAQFIDIDADGDVDLAVHGRIFLNDGTGNFREQLAFTDVGIDIDNDKDEGLTLIDYDGDGNLALYQRVRTNALLVWQRARIPGTLSPVPLQNGSVAFTATSVSTGIEAIMKANSPAYAWGDAWGDFNGDGWPDLVFQTTGKAPLVLV